MEDVILDIACPKCKEGQIFNKTNLYKCTDESCSFVLFKSFNKKEITPDLLEEIIAAGSEGIPLDGFKNKDEEEYSATVAFNTDICKFHLVYADKYLEGVLCPYCEDQHQIESQILDTPKVYKCERNDNSLPEDERCPIVIFKEIAEKPISEKVAIALLKGDKGYRTERIDGFIGKTKNKFSARLYLDEINYDVKFDFHIGNCPICDAELRDNEKSYSCTKWAEPNNCKFTLWKNQSGYAVTFKDLEDLLEKGVTKEHTFVKVDKETKYKGKLYFNPKTKEVEII